MSDDDENVPASSAVPPGNYPLPPQYTPPPQYAPPPPAPAPKKSAVGKKVLAALAVIVLAVAVKVGARLVLNKPSHHGSHSHGFDYAVGTCLNLSKTGIVVTPDEVKVEPCSSPTALSKVAKKYTGTKNCPNANYGTLEGGGSGLCLEDNLTVSSCYTQDLVSHMFKATECKPSVLSTEPTFRVALRQDGVDDPSLCSEEQQTVDFPEPPLTYCMDVLVADE
ncbi:LppU/SCO3897 family protein [Mycobacterium bourgelatii]|uniref:Uncharacterized protein n=1 Tax=Mycobacterium bourgelatii TaxID=1273442 RepID=A0A7I9YYM8_MYCBU|nr:hypothetical protein [Mycobacterium bourgelatii]MCV6976333.1 hypothetical protein [Mycobacterium bourgelatii]GFG93771.1 hypothetical protein MBOU_58130 [Mycobacterium bourgelatii]